MFLIYQHGACCHDVKIFIKNIPGFSFSSSRESKNLNFFFLCTLWVNRPEAYVTHTLYSRTSSVAVQLSSLPSICQALSVSNIWDWEQENTAVRPRICTSCTQAQLKHQQHCLQFSVVHIAGTAGA